MQGGTTAEGSPHDGTGRMLRRVIRAIRPVVASNPGTMDQIATEVVAGLRDLRPDLDAPVPPPGMVERTFAETGRLKLGVKLSPETLADIRAHFADRPVDYKDVNNESIGRGPLATAPADAFLGYHDLHDVVACPHLLDIANDPAVLAIVRHHLGFTPLIDTLIVWHSFAGRGTVASPQTLHRDKDDFRFCKLFVYLSDVDEGTGPHVYLPGSHRPDRFAEMLRAVDGGANNPLQFFVGGQRGNAAILEKAFRDRFERLTGPAGSAFLVNTYGLHKGEVPRTGNRMLFQVLYTLLPYGDVMSEMPDPVPVTETPYTGPVTPAFAYTNQLHVRC